jgi:hypothetical protein
VLFVNPNVWTTFDEYILKYSIIEVLPEIIGFIFLPSFYLSIDSIVKTNDLDNIFWGKSSRSFALMFVIIVSIGYFIQFAVVYPGIKLDNNQLLEPWIFGNPNSIGWGLNYLGWFCSGISLLILGLGLKNSLIKILFITYGILLSIAFLGYCTRILILQAVLGLAWFIIMPLSFLKVTLLFK